MAFWQMVYRAGKTPTVRKALTVATTASQRGCVVDQNRIDGMAGRNQPRGVGRRHAFDVMGISFL
jgi:hypothetical protein